MKCDGVLFFADNNNLTQSVCKSNRRKRNDYNYTLEKEGWTKSFISTDTPSGTGDHEHYFLYYGYRKLATFKAYDSNKKEYKNCIKRAVHIREKETGLPWWVLNKSNTLLFSDFEINKYRILEDAIFEETFDDKLAESQYTYKLKPEYG